MSPKAPDVEQSVRWRQAATVGAETQRRLSAAELRELQQERKKSRRFAKGLRRKDKALAETASLLVLQQKGLGNQGGEEGD